MEHTIAGRVVKGDGYGKKLGFPTVNLDSWVEKLPEVGIYSGDGIIDNTKYKAGIVVGLNKKVEAHLIGYNGDAYGKHVILTIREFLREYKNFDTEEELINQIKKDLKQC